MSNPAPTLNQINAFNATQGTTIDFNIIGGTEVIRSNKIYIYDLSDNSLICTHLYVSTESIHELPPNTSSSIIYASGKSSADFTNNTQYYAQIQTFTDVGGTQGGSGLSIAKLFWCLPTPTLTLGTIPTTISTTSYNVSATYTPNTSGGATNEIQEFQFNLYSAIGALLQTSGVVLYGEGVDLSYNFSGLEVDSTYYVTLDVTTTQGMNVSAQSNTFTVSIDTPTMGSASVVNNGCDGYISVTSNLSSEYEHEESAEAGEIMSFTTDSVNDITELDVDFSPIQDDTPWMSAQDTEPYMFRPVPTQTEDFGHESDTIVGGTVAWNQLVLDANRNFTSAISDTRPFTLQLRMFGSPYTTAFVSNLGLGKGIYTRLFVGIDTQGTGLYLTHNGSATNIEIWRNLNQQLVVGHKYLFSVNVVNNDTATVGGLVLKDMMLIDLTAMFGSTIADYIYSLEQANAGAGVAWFKKLFPKPYYAYNAGELISVKTSAHNTVGFNQLDPANTKIGGTYNPTVGNTINLDRTGATYTGTNPIEINVTAAWRGCCLISEPLVAGQQYEVAFKTSAPTTADKRTSQYLIDADNKVITSPYNWVGNSGDNVTRTFTPTESGLRCAVTIQSASAQKITVTDPCVHLVWDGERDGEYEAYDKHSYPLDSSLTLRGIPKLDNGNLYYDGDTYESDGTVTRKYGIVDLGTLTWNRESEGVFYATATSLGMNAITNTGLKSSLVCSNYIAASVNSIQQNKTGVGAYHYSGNNNDYIYIGNSAFDTAANAKTGLNGVYLVYELATPTTETADPYTNPQEVDPYGTEQYVGSSIPVGHETTYQRICPISGWDSVEVDITGNNLLKTTLISQTSFGLTFSGNADGSISIQNTSTGTYPQAVVWNKFKNVYPKNTDVTLSVTTTGAIPTGAKVYVIAYERDTPNGASIESHSTRNSGGTVTFQITHDYVVVTLVAEGNGLTYTDTKAYCQIELGTTPTTYQPYQGTTYTSTFPKYKQQVTQDKIPYITKDIGDTYADTLTENLVGGTIAWNQSVPDTTTTHTVSGSIASMDDAVAGNFESVVCDITPLQDLHGYDKPWVGGAGKNKADSGYSWTIGSTGIISEADYNSCIVKVENGKTYTHSINGVATNIVALAYYSSYPTVGSQSYDSSRITSVPSTFTAPIDGYAVIRNASSTTNIQVEEGSSATTFEPYENLCPITGWTGCEVDVSGVNVWGGTLYCGSTYSKLTFAKSAFLKKGTYIVSASNIKNATSWRFGFMLFESNGTVITSPMTKGFVSFNMTLYDTYSSNTVCLQSNNVKYTSIQMTLTRDAYVGCMLGFGDVTESTTTADFQIELGSTATTYHAYNGTTYPVSWQTEAGTVYGGTLDLVTGVLTVDRKLVNIDPSTVNINAVVTGGGRYIVTTTDAKDVQTSDPIAYTICNTLKSITSDSIEIGGSSLISSKRLSFMLPVSTQAEARQWFTDNPTTVVYPLAQAQTYQLDPVQVACLLEQNNVWNNISNTTVTYPTNHSYQSLSTTHKYYKRINGVESISVGSDVVADVGTDNIIDLTQMFGTTIADYIYNREQSSSSGMGVKFFKSLFPSNDYDYNSGTLISVNASAHVIKDANGNVLHTYPLDSDLVLRGIPKLDANNRLYYDGDVYEPDGSVTRKYGIVDMGTLTWRLGSTSGGGAPRMVATLSDIKNTNGDGTVYPNIICTKYLVSTPNLTYNRNEGITTNIGNHEIIVFDANYSDKDAFKTAMNGVYAVYELATPTTEQADPFEENQAIVSNGIEEYIVTEQGDVEMPVGHDSAYYTTKVYGGTIDMAKGVLTVTHKVVDLGTIGATYNSGWNCWVLSSGISGAKVVTSNTTPTTAISSNMIAVQASGYIASHATGTLAQNTNGYFFFDNGSTTELTGQLVYELATPIEISLTPQQMQTLSGQNNIWSNTNGGMYLVYQLPITSLLVKRRDVADISGKWLTLYSTPITQASDMDFTFIDFLNQYGKTYQYALVPVLAQNQSGVIVQIEGGYTVSDNVDSIFDGVYIADQTNVERVKAGVGYGNIDMNQGVGSITPIGSKYPIVITNSQNQYHNGSIRGTIVPNDFYSNGNLSRMDMVNKRDELEQFLTNKRAKIIKDWNGKMWLVMIMSNVACSFDDNYGMGMVSFSADWLEVGDPTSQQDLYNAGLINVGGV